MPRQQGTTSAISPPVMDELSPVSPDPAFSTKDMSISLAEVSSTRPVSILSYNLIQLTTTCLEHRATDLMMQF